MNNIEELILDLAQEIEIIKTFIKSLRKTRFDRFSESWIDGQDVMQALHISKRTLQSLRDNNTMPFSRLNGKLYYKLSDIEKMLEANYSKNTHGNK